MKDWKLVPIPQLMLDNCERDPRGLPVPYVVLKDKEGKHHFKINDTEKTVLCMIQGLCTICGQKMDQYERWLVGGIGSAFDEKGYYIDHPVHKCCAVYALQVCPYLAVRNYNTLKTDVEKIASQVSGSMTLVNPTADQDRLPLFVLIKPPAIKYVAGENDIYVVPVRANMEIEYWDEGKRIFSLDEITRRLKGTKWEKYLPEIQKSWTIS